MAVQLYSSEDFALTTTDVDIAETFQLAKASHSTKTISSPVARWNADVLPVKMDIANNARTVSGAMNSGHIAFICDPLSAGCSTFGASNERSLQDLYLEMIAVSLYGAGAADSTQMKTIGSSQILAASGVPIAAADVAGASTFSEALFQNCGDLAKEAVAKFSGALNNNLTASGKWLEEMLNDAHENVTSVARTEADNTDNNTTEDKVHMKLLAGDSIALYFRITCSTDDGVLSSTSLRTDTQGDYSNPALDSVRAEVVISLV